MWKRLSIGETHGIHSDSSLLYVRWSLTREDRTENQNLPLLRLHSRPTQGKKARRREDRNRSISHSTQNEERGRHKKLKHSSNEECERSGNSARLENSVLHFEKTSRNSFSEVPKANTSGPWKQELWQILGLEQRDIGKATTTNTVSESYRLGRECKSKVAPAEAWGSKYSSLDAYYLRYPSH
jgi:hypothetical protein